MFPIVKEGFFAIHDFDLTKNSIPMAVSSDKSLKIIFNPMVLKSYKKLSFNINPRRPNPKLYVGKWIFIIKYTKQDGENKEHRWKTYLSDLKTLICTNIIIKDAQGQCIPTEFEIHYKHKKYNLRLSGLENKKSARSTSVCYMNSILQVLFHIDEFRKILYSLDFPIEISLEYLTVSALKDLFIMMESEGTYTTYELTNSFGWNEQIRRYEHDANEFLVKFLEHLEEKFQILYKTNAISDLFQVIYKEKNSINNISNIASHELIIQVQEGLSTIKESLDFYGNPENLNWRFIKLPPVLFIQLGRSYSQNVSYTKFGFENEIDFKDYLDDSFDQNCPTGYSLNGIVVHISYAAGKGHYYTLLKPHLKYPIWVRFDDDAVNPFNCKLTEFDSAKSITNKQIGAVLLVYFRNDLKTQNIEIPAHEHPKTSKDSDQGMKRSTTPIRTESIEENQVVKFSTEEDIIVGLQNGIRTFKSIEFRSEITIDRSITIRQLYNIISTRLGLNHEEILLKNPQHEEFGIINPNFRSLQITDVRYFSQSSESKRFYVERKPFNYCFEKENECIEIYFIRFNHTDVDKTSFITKIYIHKSSKLEDYKKQILDCANISLDEEADLYYEVKPHILFPIAWNNTIYDLDRVFTTYPVKICQLGAIFLILDTPNLMPNPDNRLLCFPSKYNDVQLLSFSELYSAVNMKKDIANKSKIVFVELFSVLKKKKDIIGRIKIIFDELYANIENENDINDKINSILNEIYPVLQENKVIANKAKIIFDELKHALREGNEIVEKIKFIFDEFYNAAKNDIEIPIQAKVIFEELYSELKPKKDLANKAKIIFDMKYNSIDINFYSFGFIGGPKFRLRIHKFIHVETLIQMLKLHFNLGDQILKLYLAYQKDCPFQKEINLDEKTTIDNLIPESAMSYASFYYKVLPQASSSYRIVYSEDAKAPLFIEQVTFDSIEKPTVADAVSFLRNENISKLDFPFRVLNIRSGGIEQTVGMNFKLSVYSQIRIERIPDDQLNETRFISVSYGVRVKNTLQVALFGDPFFLPLGDELTFSERLMNSASKQFSYDRYCITNNKGKMNNQITLQEIVAKRISQDNEEIKSQHFVVLLVKNIGYNLYLNLESFCSLSVRFLN